MITQTLETINVALIGIGNCASALIQGLYYYIDHPDESLGLINKQIGPFCLPHIKVVAAFDIDSDKVGKDLCEGIYLGENNVINIAHVPRIGTIISPAPVLDSLGDRYRNKLSNITEGTHSEVINVLRESKTEIIVNYLPVGSAKATRWWADVAIQTGCAFINCIPEFIASDIDMAQKFKRAGLPIFGDDVKSQFGATLLHRIIVQHLENKGFKIDKTYQLNFGGNMDFYNMLDENRLNSKRISKRESVRSLQRIPLELDKVHIGPSGYVSWLEDNKWCYIHFQGRGFANVPFRLETKLEVCDSPNSAGVVVDLIRHAKLALSTHQSGAISDVCSYYMKTPPIPMNDDEAQIHLDTWLKKTLLYGKEKIK